MLAAFWSPSCEPTRQISAPRARRSKARAACAPPGRADLCDAAGPAGDHAQLRRKKRRRWSSRPDSNIIRLPTREMVSAHSLPRRPLPVCRDLTALPERCSGWRLLAGGTRRQVTEAAHFVGAGLLPSLRPPGFLPGGVGSATVPGGDCVGEGGWDRGSVGGRVEGTTGLCPVAPDPVVGSGAVVTPVCGLGGWRLTVQPDPASSQQGPDR